MTRFRWLKAEWPISMDALGKRLKTKPFDASVNHGFVIDRLRSDYLEGRYIERIEYSETVVDPFGSELKFDRIEFRQSSFRAAAHDSGLELRDPPRSIQALMNRLSEAADFDVSITAKTVDVLAWAAEFQRLVAVSPIVDSLQLSSLTLDQGITAKVLVKGDRDVRAASATFVADRKVTLEKIQLRLAGSRPGTIVLSKTASATLAIDDPGEEILNALRIAITQSEPSADVMRQVSL